MNFYGNSDSWSREWGLWKFVPFLWNPWLYRMFYCSTYIATTKLISTKSSPLELTWNLLLAHGSTYKLKKKISQDIDKLDCNLHDSRKRGKTYSEHTRVCTFCKVHKYYCRILSKWTYIRMICDFISFLNRPYQFRLWTTS